MFRIGVFSVFGCLALNEQDDCSLMQTKQPKVSSATLAADQAMLQRSRELHAVAAKGSMEKSLSWKRSCPEHIVMTMNRSSVELPTLTELGTMFSISQSIGHGLWTKGEDIGGHPRYNTVDGKTLSYSDNRWRIHSAPAPNTTNTTELLTSPEDLNYDCHPSDGAWTLIAANQSAQVFFNRVLPPEVHDGENPFATNGYQRRFHWGACAHTAGFMQSSSYADHSTAESNGFMECNAYRTWCDFYTVTCTTPSDATPWKGTDCRFDLYSMTGAAGAADCADCAFQFNHGKSVYYKDAGVRNNDYYRYTPQVADDVRRTRESIVANNTACPVFD